MIETDERAARTFAAGGRTDERANRADQGQAERRESRQGPWQIQGRQSQWKVQDEAQDQVGCTPKPLPGSQFEIPAAAPTMPPNLDVATMTAEQRAVVEKLSMNLARAALTAQGAIAEMALRQADRPAALSPDPFHVGSRLSPKSWAALLLSPTG